MNQIHYKLGQVKWAAWRYFTATRLGAPKAVPPPFANRVKRLLELDRKMEKDAMSETRQARFAFHDTPPGGKGAEQAYSPFNVFMLAIGLDFVEAGFKQLEVVFLLRHIRHWLIEHFEWIQNNPPAFRQRLHPKDRPDCPTYQDGRVEVADCRVFLLVDQSEFLELFPGMAENWPKGRPIFLEPAFCRGVEELGVVLSDRMPNRRRKTFVLELAHAAALVPRFLEKSPAFSRGRGSV